MRRKNDLLDDARIQAAAEELMALIQRRWPSARFRLSLGEDPEGVDLDVTVDVEDPDEVVDAVIDRLVELHVDEGIPIHVIVLRSPERLAEIWKSRPRRYALAADPNRDV